MEELNLAANNAQYETGVMAQQVFCEHPRLRRLDLRGNKSAQLGLLRVCFTLLCLSHSAASATLPSASSRPVLPCLCLRLGASQPESLCPATGYACLLMSATSPCDAGNSSNQGNACQAWSC
jgi:hypothetical protein